MNFYIASLSAIRDHPADSERIEVSISTTCLLFEPDTGTDTVEGSLKDECLRAFPVEFGWRDHQEGPVIEVPSGTKFGKPETEPVAFLFNWEASRVDEAETYD